MVEVPPEVYELVRLVVHVENRLKEGPRFHSKQHDENKTETKQNRRNAIEKTTRHIYICNIYIYIYIFFFNLTYSRWAQRCHNACGHQGSFHLSPVHALQILSRCKFSTLTTRQPMVEIYLLTYEHFPLRTPESNSCFDKN